MKYKCKYKKTQTKEILFKVDKLKRIGVNFNHVIKTYKTKRQKLKKPKKKKKRKKMGQRAGL